MHPVHSASAATFAAGGASAAARVAPPPSVSSPALLEPERFRVIRGNGDDYEVLSHLDRESAAAVAQQTGLTIPFPPGKSTIGIVTTWTEDPRGKLCLGQGASGVFCIGRGVHTHKYIGLKIGELGEGTRHEVAVQRALKGVPGILQALDFIETTDQACQVIELAGLGSAAKLRLPIQSLDDSNLRDQIFYDIAKGLLEAISNMHKGHHYHLDIKPDNLVVTHEGKVLLIDFDCAHRSDSESFDTRELRGDKRYYAPERYFAQWSGMRDYATCSGPKMDAFSAGMLLLELISEREVAFDPDELDTVLNTDYSGLPPALKQLLTGFESASPRQRFELLIARRLGGVPPNGLGNVINGLLRTDPDARLTVDQALQDPWFAEMERTSRAHNSRDRLKEMVQHLVMARQAGSAYSPQDLPQISTTNHLHRRDLQLTVRDHLLSDSRQTALQGGHGTGKSHLAAFMLGHPAIGAHYGSIYWFRGCDSQSRIQEQFLILAQEFGLVEQKATFEEAFPLLKQHLASQDKPWLIVYDNAGDPTLLTPYLELTGGHSLITSNSDWPDAIPVGKLSECDAHRLAQLLLQREDSDIPRLCHELTYLPLALAQACAYIRNQKSSVADYLRLIEQAPAALAAGARQDGYRDLPYSIQRMYELTFEKLEERGAMPLLHRIACLAPDQIPKSLIDRLGEAEPLNVLINYEMLQPRGADSYTLHRLPRRILQSNLSPQDLEEALAPAMGAVCNAWQPDPDSVEGYAQNQALLRHGEELLHLRIQFASLPASLRAPLARTMRLTISILGDMGRPREAIPLLEEIVPLARTAWNGGNQALAACLNTTGNAWHALGEHRKAIEYHEQALEIKKRAFGDNHPDVAISLNNLGSAWSALGEPRKAIEYFEQALEIKKRAFGNNHPDVAGSLNNLGSAWQHLGEPRKAIEYHEQALEIQKRALGDNHPDVTGSFNNLGAAWSDLGEPRKAIEHYEQALEIQKRALGDNHPDVASSLNNLGNAWHALGEHRKAIEYHEQALEIKKRALGDNHPDVAGSFNNLGAAWNDLGEHRKAIDYHEQALEIQKRALGDNHPDVASSLNNLGNAWHALGEHRKAIEYYEQALEIQKRAFGDNHPDVAVSLNNLGSAWGALGEPRKAIEYFEQALEIKKGAFGNNHPDVAVSLNNLGSAWQHLGEPRKAIEYHEQALQIQKRAFGDNHPDVAISLNNLGVAWYKLGEPRKAIEYHEQALEIQKRAFGDNHPDVAISLNNLGVAWYKLGEPRKAIEYQEQALEIKKRALGDNHPDVASSLNNLGSAWDDLGEHRKAIEYHEQALEIKKRALGDNHPDVASSLNNLGNAWNDLGEHRKAIEYHEQALEIRKRAFGDDHPDVAASLGNIGNAWDDLGDHRKAIEYHEQALEIQKRAFGDDHPDVAASLGNIGNAWHKLGEPRKAIEYHEQALEIQKRAFGDNHPDVAKSLGNIGNAWQALGEHRKAIEYHEQALEIKKSALGDNHPDVASSLNNLGITWSRLGEHRKAIEYYEQVLGIDKRVLGDNHPDVATSLYNLGIAWQALGEHRKAIEYHEQAYQIAVAHPSMGEEHPHTQLMRLGLEDARRAYEQSVAGAGNAASVAAPSGAPPSGQSASEANGPAAPTEATSLVGSPSPRARNYGRGQAGCQIV